MNKRWRIGDGFSPFSLSSDVCFLHTRLIFSIGGVLSGLIQQVGLFSFLEGRDWEWSLKIWLRDGCSAWFQKSDNSNWDRTDPILVCRSQSHMDHLIQVQIVPDRPRSSDPYMGSSAPHKKKTLKSSFLIPPSISKFLFLQKCTNPSLILYKYYFNILNNI